VHTLYAVCHRRPGCNIDQHRLSKHLMSAALFHLLPRWFAQPRRVQSFVAQLHAHDGAALRNFSN
jgi:hypothetical protein